MGEVFQKLFGTQTKIISRNIRVPIVFFRTWLTSNWPYKITKWQSWHVGATLSTHFRRNCRQLCTGTKNWNLQWKGLKRICRSFKLIDKRWRNPTLYKIVQVLSHIFFFQKISKLEQIHHQKLTEGLNAMNQKHNTHLTDIENNFSQILQARQGEFDWKTNNLNEIYATKISEIKTEHEGILKNKDEEITRLQNTLNEQCKRFSSVVSNYLRLSQCWRKCINCNLFTGLK